MELRNRSDRDLLTDLAALIGSHRELTAKLVAYLGEIEHRRLQLHAGFSSMFEYCVRELRMGENEAFRRILAARLARRFPVIFSLLETGALNLTSLELLRGHLTAENHAELLEAATGKTKRELEELLAVRFPRPDVPERLRALSFSSKRVGAPAGTTTASNSETFSLQPSIAPAAVEPRPRLEPLSSTRYRLELTVSATLRDKLELCRDLLSHANPTRDLEPVLERAVDLLLADLERKRLALTKRSRRTKMPAKMASTPAPTDAHEEKRIGRPIAAATRREVFERDGLQCTFVSPSGRVCEARAFLELDHADPRALGGSNDASNLRVRCRAHNQLWAEEVFGREHIERARSTSQESSAHFCWQKSTDQHDEQRTETAGHFCQQKWTGDSNGESTPQLSSTLEKVRLALRTMGFTRAEARCAVAEAQDELDDNATVEEALRKALVVATRAA